MVDPFRNKYDPSLLSLTKLSRYTLKEFKKYQFPIIFISIQTNLNRLNTEKASDNKYKQ